MTNLITDEKFAPARTLIPERLKQVMDARIKIISGSGMDEGSDRDDGLPTNKEICIMEVTAYILGYTAIDDEPPCTSAKIRKFMIKLNDSIESDRKRAQLKHVIPDIINTAPTKWIKEYGGGHKLVVAHSKEYRKAENQRSDMIDIFEDSSPECNLLLRPMHELHTFIRELAAVAKFDGTQELLIEATPTEEVKTDD